MQDIRIFFFDIDGTLLDHATGRISDKTAETLRRLRARGAKICIATGRPPASLPDLGGLEIDAFLTCNGALCYTQQEIIYSHPLAREDVAKVMKNAASIGRPVSLAIRNRLIANGIDQDLEDYYAIAGLVLSVSPDFAEASQNEVYQIMLGCQANDHDTILRGVKGAKLTRSWDRAVDIIPAFCGKDSGIAKVLDHFGLEPSQAVAFGDSYNDIEMLQFVGKGIAMGNAPDQLKALASDVCGSVSEDGIYRYCLEHGLI